MKMWCVCVVRCADFFPFHSCFSSHSLRSWRCVGDGMTSTTKCLIMLIWKRPTDSEARRQHIDDNWTSDLPPFILIRKQNASPLRPQYAHNISSATQQVPTILLFRSKYVRVRTFLGNRPKQVLVKVITQFFDGKTNEIEWQNFLKNLNQWIQSHSSTARNTSPFIRNIQRKKKKNESTTTKCVC